MRKTAIRAEFEAGEPRMFESRAQLAKRAEQYHPLDGQLVPRSGDAGLLAAIIAGEVPSCSDADWLADPKKRSNYTLGDGSTNIRLPDRNGKVSGTVGSVFARGDGDNSPVAGIIHGDAIRNFRGTITPTLIWKDTPTMKEGIVQIGIADKNFGGASTSGSGVYFAQAAVYLEASGSVPVATQNRPTSISQVWAVKR